MSRLAILNVILGVIAAGLVATLVVLETSDDAAPATTTTSTTSTTLPPETTTTSSTSTTSTSTTTSTTTTTEVPPTTEVPVVPFFVATVVVNGSTAGERLPPAVGRLRDAGYGTVRGLTGVVVTQSTTIYAFDEEWRGEAEAVAIALGYEPDGVPIELFEDAPPVPGVLDARVMVYLGADELPELPE